MNFIITGSYPPDICGVGDYTFRLTKELEKNGEKLLVLKPKTAAFVKVLWHRILVSFDKKIKWKLLIQYPTAGYGKSILPHCFSIAGRILGYQVVVTMHEYSSLSDRAKMAARIFFYFSNKVIFTNEMELQAASKFVKNKGIVIPIASNIPEAALHKIKSYDVGYFGMISPGKGIEDFLAICKSLGNSHRSFLMGQIPHYFKEYGRKIIMACEEANIEVMLDKSPEDVADFLAALKFAVLPFPDGLTPRRGSALAAMLNSSQGVSYQASEFSNLFDEVAVLCSDLEDMQLKVNALLADGANQRKIRNAKKYALELSWSNVARKYIEI